MVTGPVTQVRVVYGDGTTEYINLNESAFGLDGTRAHGPVRSATIVRRHEDDGGPVASGRAARSLVREAREDAA